MHGVLLFVVRRRLDSAYLVDGRWDTSGAIQAHTPADVCNELARIMPTSDWANCEIVQLMLPN